jgi:hypothetical protein
MVKKNTFADPMAIYAFNTERHLGIRLKIMRTLDDTFGFVTRMAICLDYLKEKKLQRTHATIEDTITLYCNTNFNFE